MKRITVSIIALLMMVSILAGCERAGDGSAASNSEAEQASKDVTIGMCPKLTSGSYMIEAGNGAQEACDELGYALDFNGPVDADVSAQVDIIAQWTQKGYSAITVSSNDENALSPAMQAAKNAGVFTSTWDADIQPEARDFFVKTFTSESLAKTIVECMIDACGTDDGNFLILTSTLTAPNQNEWIQTIREYVAAEHPNFVVADVLPGDEDVVKSKDVTMNYLRSHPDTKGVIVLTCLEVAGAVEAVEQLGLEGQVYVTGSADIPNLVREYIKNGAIMKSGYAIIPHDMGYASVYVIKTQLEGNAEKAKEDGYIEAGRLGRLEIIDKEKGIVLLGDPIVFDANNIDDYEW
jgi:ABC-type sugar transport system substrate-binding protein